METETDSFDDKTDDITKKKQLLLNLDLLFDDLERAVDENKIVGDASLVYPKPVVRYTLSQFANIYLPQKETGENRWFRSFDGRVIALKNDFDERLDAFAKFKDDLRPTAPGQALKKSVARDFQWVPFGKFGNLAEVFLTSSALAGDSVAFDSMGEVLSMVKVKYDSLTASLMLEQLVRWSFTKWVLSGYDVKETDKYKLTGALAYSLPVADGQKFHAVRSKVSKGDGREDKVLAIGGQIIFSRPFLDAVRSGGSMPLDIVAYASLEGVAQNVFKWFCIRLPYLNDRRETKVPMDEVLERFYPRFTRNAKSVYLQRLLQGMKNALEKYPAAQSNVYYDARKDLLVMKKTRHLISPNSKKAQFRVPLPDENL